MMKVWQAAPVGPLMASSATYNRVAYLCWLSSNGASDETGRCVDCRYYSETDVAMCMDAECAVSGDSIEYHHAQKANTFQRSNLRPNRPHIAAGPTTCKCKAFRSIP